MSQSIFPTCQIGDFQVTALSDGTMSVSLDLLGGIETAEACDIQHRAGIRDAGQIHIYAYLVRGQGRTVLVDAGTGGANNAGGDLLRNLSAIGVRAGEIDTVLLTHGHPDHLGGLLNLKGERAFTHAQLYIHPREAAYWTDDAMMAQGNERQKRNFHLARATFAAYAEQLHYLGEGDAIAGIAPVELPGHTPGHTGFRIDGADNSLLIWGDIVHFPHIQSARPAVSIAFDGDPVLAQQTREAIMAQASRYHWLVAGMHFGKPGFAHVYATDKGYQLVYVDAQTEGDFSRR